MNYFQSTGIVNTGTQQFLTLCTKFENKTNILRTVAVLRRKVSLLVNMFRNLGVGLAEADLQSCSYKRCSENMQKIYRRALIPNCDFNKIALQLY